MNAKIRRGSELLFCEGESNKYYKLKNEIIINFNDKYTYKSFKQIKNHLLINTTQGEVDIVFTGEPPNLEFDFFEKDQLVLKFK